MNATQREDAVTGGQVAKSALVLTVRQPWAWLMFHTPYPKDLENRSARTHVRGRIYIHTSQKLYAGDYDFCRDFLLTNQALRKAGVVLPARHTFTNKEAGALSLGRVVGLVELVDCVEKSESPWWMGGPFGYVLARPIQLGTASEPVKGSLGFWHWEGAHGLA